LGICSDAPTPKLQRQARKSNSLTKGRQITPASSHGHAGMHISRNGVDMFIASEVQICTPRQRCDAPGLGFWRAGCALLFRGSWAAVRRGRSGRAAGEAMEGVAFSRGQATAWMPELRQRRSGCPSTLEKPGRDSRTFRPRMDGKRQPGWPSLWVTFLLATQEKSNSGAGRRTKLL